MTNVLTLLPVLACIAMMLGAGALAWVTTRTPLRRVRWLTRRAHQSEPVTPDSTTARRG
jgi:hypothetical protein